jgi:hypothetical protein
MARGFELSEEETRRPFSGQPARESFDTERQRLCDPFRLGLTVRQQALDLVFDCSADGT